MAAASHSRTREPPITRAWTRGDSHRTTPACAPITRGSPSFVRRSVIRPNKIRTEIECKIVHFLIGLGELYRLNGRFISARLVERYPRFLSRKGAERNRKNAFSLTSLGMWVSGKCLNPSMWPQLSSSFECVFVFSSLDRCAPVRLGPPSRTYW